MYEKEFVVLLLLTNHRTTSHAHNRKPALARPAGVSPGSVRIIITVIFISSSFTAVSWVRGAVPNTPRGLVRLRLTAA